VFRTSVQSARTKIEKKTYRNMKANMHASSSEENDTYSYSGQIQQINTSKVNFIPKKVSNLNKSELAHCIVVGK
jgi:hypothetical protein